jgi:D-xylose transport system substrate-binding protein
MFFGRPLYHLVHCRFLRHGAGQGPRREGQGQDRCTASRDDDSARYASFDQPYLKKAFEAAGLTADQYIITNAQGSESTELTQAQSAISQGATVLAAEAISDEFAATWGRAEAAHPPGVDD